MKVISNRQIVTDDWQHIGDDADISQLAAGKLIIPLSFWTTHREELQQRNTPLGLKLDSDVEIDTLAADLSNFDLIALTFPGFRDGRAYSQARILRQQYHYQGELRATGNVLRDQLMYMERVGFNSFEVDSKQDINDALKAFDEIGIKYQASSDEPLPFYKRRSA